MSEAVRPFKLSPAFLEEYEGKQPDWGPVGYITYKRTYARTKYDGTTEEFWETCKRVVEGCYFVQKQRCHQLGLSWDNNKAQRSAQEMFRRMWEFKWLPPGRGLWMMGTPYIQRTSAGLNNCGMVSTAGIAVDFADPFCWLMDMLMLGVGVGFDTKGAGLVKIHEPKEGDDEHVVADSREGWVELIRRVLTAYTGRGSLPRYIDYSLVRPAGEPIRGFGGTASGPEPLDALVQDIQEVLDPLVGSYITSDAIVDICNLIGKCVVAGNIRRCLPENSLVHTKRGLIPISHVKEGDFVQTSKGWDRVSKVFDQGIQETCIVSTQLGDLEATPNHKVKVFVSTNEFTFKRIDELIPGDRLVFNAKLQDYENDTELPEWTYNKPENSTTCKDITIPELNENISWFLGLLAGDGYVFPNFKNNGFNAHVSVACSPDYHDIIENCKDVIKSFGTNLCDVLPSENDKSYKVRSQSKQLAWYLSQFKEANEPLIVPSCVKKGPPTLRASYIAGLFDADGSCLTRPLQVACSVYPSFLKEVQAVLATLGIPSRLKKRREAKGNWQPLFSLNVVGELALDRFSEIVGVWSCKYERKTKTSRSQNDFGFPSEWIDKYTRLWNNQSRQMTVGTYERVYETKLDQFPVEVLEINPGKAVKTYDLEVENTHEFVVDCGLIVHNSAEIAFGEPKDLTFLDLKNTEVWGEDIIYDHRWASNNSVFASVGMDYSEVAERTARNGEPGYEWLENARAYGRMGRDPDYKDRRAVGGNPCFSADTLVAVADGRHAVPFKQLAEEGKDVPVYSLTKEGNVEIQWGRNPRKTRTGSKLVRIHMDDDSYLDVTPDHSIILRDGSVKAAKDLIPGDSLPVVRKAKEQIKKGGNNYWRLGIDVNDCNNRVFEHRVISNFFESEKWQLIYDENKKAGWIKGGLVVHHKDYDSLNNTPENLEIMTFKDHAKFHADFDRSGENNGMYGKKHSDETKVKIGQKTLERTKDPEFRKKLSQSHSPEERKKSSNNFKRLRAKWGKEYYIEQEKVTDLDTVWIGETMFAKKVCEHCSTEFVVPWGKRDRIYCSTSCFNVYLADLEKRKEGQRTFFRNRQQEVLHNQILIYKDLCESLGRNPLKKEWERACKDNNVSYRFRSGSSSTDNPYCLESFKDLKERALDYNHRVVRVEELSGTQDVYNITVDKNHTVMICLTKDFESSDSLYLQGVLQCLEQTLEDRELCCVSGDTRILTKDGYPKIEDVVGKPVDVWNGKNWSTVTPFLAAKNKKLYRVTLSDGSYLDVTDNHGWSVKKPTQQLFRKVNTLDLQEGMILEVCEPSRSETGIRFEQAYQAGWICGDGFIDGKKVMALVQEPEYSVLPYLGGVVYKEQKPKGYSRPFKRVNLSSVIPLEFGKALRDSDSGLPEEMFYWDAQSISEFVAGWIDTDGTVRHQKYTDNFIICSTSENKLRDLQLLLRKIGVNHATISKWREKGHKTNYGSRNKALWTIYIPSYEAMYISPKLKQAFRFGSRYRVNYAHPEGKKIDSARKQKIVSIEELTGLHDTFCFTEPYEHKGVFGNCLTYQCLSESFPSRHESYEDYERTLKYAYLYAKTVTLLSTHDSRTNQVLLRNRRIGMSMSGIAQAMAKHGRREFFNWCDRGYRYLKDLDKIYSDWLCVRESIKITSVKPSGTVSLLPGVTPGIHYPHSQYYIRRIRFKEGHPLVDVLKDHGYNIENDKYSPGTVVAEFPIKEDYFDRSKSEVTMWEQLELAAQMQQFWADNQVSVTVTFDESEAKDIKYALELYETRLKGVSFLPVQDHGYAQAPYEEITKEQYEEMASKVVPVTETSNTIQHDITERFCDGDACEIDWSKR